MALTAANRVSHEILEGLSANDLRGASGNALVAHPAGILQGIDYQFTGRVERVDTPLLQALLEKDIVPIIPPLGCDGEGKSYRLNSDAESNSPHLHDFLTIPNLLVTNFFPRDLARAWSRRVPEGLLRHGPVYWPPSSVAFKVRICKPRPFYATGMPNLLRAR